MEYPSLNRENVQTYYPLGNKTLFLLILKKSPAFLILFTMWLVALFNLNLVPAGYMEAVTSIIWLWTALLVFALLVVIFAGWLEYFRYGIIISEKNLIIKKGFIATEEIGIPFRRIRDMKIRRSLVDQILGVSDIVVILSDFEERGNSEEESIVFLPSLDKKIAIQIQESILKKSQVEQIDVLSGHENMLEKVDR